MADKEKSSLPTQSRVHRFQVGDRVALTTDGHDDLKMNEEGEVVDFNNEEETYLDVQMDEHDDVFTLTEDELRRLAG